MSLLEQTLGQDMDFSSLYTFVLLKSIICIYFIHYHGSPHSITSDQGIHLTANKAWESNMLKIGM